MLYYVYKYVNAKMKKEKFQTMLPIHLVHLLEM